jgi:serine/threonine-protein kinase HipA
VEGRAVRRLEARLVFGPADVRRVGALAETEGRVWWSWDEAFLASGLPISPLRLPTLPPRVVEHRPKDGVPIPGVFNDSRPDGWGLRVLHRRFQSLGRPTSSVSPLEELAVIGSGTMGALTWHPSEPAGFGEALDVAALARHASAIAAGAADEVLPALVRAGGSPGGARPKLLVGLTGGAEMRSGEGELPPGWEAWLLKLPLGHEDAEATRREAVWMSLAEAAGIEVPESRLMAVEGVGEALLTRRFDRPGGGRRLHLLSVAGALDVDFRTASMDYRDLLRLTAAMCDGDLGAVEAMYRRAVFNVVVGNDDDHLKNFSFLMDDAGRWSLSPAYDLTWSPRPWGERATTVLGASRDIDGDTLRALAADVGLPPRVANAAIDAVRAAASEAGARLRAAGCVGEVSRAAERAVVVGVGRVR